MLFFTSPHGGFSADCIKQGFFRIFSKRRPGFIDIFSPVVYNVSYIFSCRRTISRQNIKERITMQCYVCGTVFEDGLPCCPVCGTVIPEAEAAPMYDMQMPPLDVQPPMSAPVAAYKKPHIALRIGMQFLSFVLCLILTVALPITVVLADVHTLTSSGGIKQIVTAVLLPNNAPAAPRPVAQARVTRLAATETAAEPAAGSNPIVDMLYEAIQDSAEGDTSVTKEQLQTLVENSTLADYIAEKTAGYAEDLLNGTENTEITADELVQLVRENKQVIEQTLDIELTAEAMADIEANMAAMVEENDLNGTIRSEINNAMESMAADGSGVPIAEVLEGLRILSQDTVLFGAIGICVLLIVLLCGANFYNVPAGLTWAAVPCILIGGILAAPIAILQLTPTVLGELAGYASVVDVLAVNHYAAPVLGLLMLIGSIVWRIARSCIRNNREEFE